MGMSLPRRSLMPIATSAMARPIPAWTAWSTLRAPATEPTRYVASNMACLGTLDHHRRAFQARQPPHGLAAWLTLASRAFPKTKSTRASCTARRRNPSTRRRTAPSRTRKLLSPALPTSKMRPMQRTAPSPSSMPHRAPLPLRPP